MSSRQLPALSWPLAHPQWRALTCEAGHWALLSLDPAQDPRPLQRVDVVLDLDAMLWLRLRCPPGRGGRALWPEQWHVVLRQAQHPGLWSLLRAALASGRRRHWWGAP